jgi:S1-C subfamily serine protease
MDTYTISESDSWKWKGLTCFLVLVVIVNAGVFTYTYWSLTSQVSDLQDQVSCLQADLQENRWEIGQLHLQLEGFTHGNQSVYLVYTQVFEFLKDSVVLITTRVATIYGLEEYAQGSGFVCDGKGHVLTNHHVIDGADEVQVTFTSGSMTTATVVGADPYNDIAVIKVDLPTEAFHPVVLGNSSALRVGEPVVAIGNPYGLSGTITAGIISQVGRELSAPGGYKIVDIIQLDAAINPGNSGGPLVTMRGEVVGMTTAIVTGSTGVGFAIPSDTIRRELPSLLATGTYIHPWLGILGNDVTPEIATAIGLNYTHGILIADVAAGGPAEQAGLQGGDRTEQIGGTLYTVGGDVVVEMDNKTIRNFRDLSVYLERNTRPGDTIALTLIRDAQKLTVDVTLGDRPPP